MNKATKKYLGKSAYTHFTHNNYRSTVNDRRLPPEKHRMSQIVHKYKRKNRSKLCKNLTFKFIYKKWHDRKNVKPETRHLSQWFYPKMEVVKNE